MLSASALTSAFTPATGGAGVSSISPNISGATNGDVVIMVVLGYNDSATATTFTPPSGWTEWTTADSSGGGPQAAWIGWRVKQAGDTTFTWTLASGVGSIVALAWDVSGANTTTPLDVASTPVFTQPSAAPYTIVSNTATAAATGELWFIVALGDGAFSNGTPLVSSATPSGFTKDFDFGTSDSAFADPQAAGFRANAVSVSTSIPAFTTTFSGGGFSGFVPMWTTSFAVKAAPVSTPVVKNFETLPLRVRRTKFDPTTFAPLVFVAPPPPVLSKAIPPLLAQAPLRRYNSQAGITVFGNGISGPFPGQSAGLIVIPFFRSI
jgi:hypothetical protein